MYKNCDYKNCEFLYNSYFDKCNKFPEFVEQTGYKGPLDLY